MGRWHMSFVDFIALLIVLGLVIGFARYVRRGNAEMIRSQLDMHRARAKAIKGQYDTPERDSSDEEKP